MDLKEADKWIQRELANGFKGSWQMDLKESYQMDLKEALISGFKHNQWTWFNEHMDEYWEKDCIKSDREKCKMHKTGAEKSFYGSTAARRFKNKNFKI